ncbi:MAG: SUMF1/EgtB/PvdO family nonheme iron enzyme, partial [Deltaproteobacteria bacterium]|nr:SUMF1/EgtB/PvdO family nonheme iron enzyme [Deltaproteobacteria bacterium]
AGAGVDVMGAGVGAGRKTGKRVTKTDGDQAACKQGTLEDGEPPPKCGSILRVELVPLIRAGAVARGGDTRPSAPACPDDMAMLPGGKFKRAHGGQEATLAPFCMDRTEVTIGAYQECVKAGKCQPLGSTATYPNITADERKWRSAFCPGQRLGSNPKYPATCVEWDMAVSYCWFKRRRLPSDVEFEWATRGGTNGWTYPWGNDEPQEKHMCTSLILERAQGPSRGYRERFGTVDEWLRAQSPDSEVGSCEVGSRAAGANPEGVHDLLGNAWEWVWAAKDGVKVYPAAGAGWNTGNGNYVKASGIWTSDWEPTSRSSDTGFRCVSAPN